MKRKEGESDVDYYKRYLHFARDHHFHDAIDAIAKKYKVAVYKSYIENCNRFIPPDDPTKNRFIRQLWRVLKRNPFTEEKSSLK